MSAISRVKVRKRRTIANGTLGTIGLLIALMVICVASGLNRMAVPLPNGLSCSMRYALVQSCAAELGAQEKDNPAADLGPQTVQLAQFNPGNATAQAIAGAFAEKKGRLETAGQFYANAARLGWREPTGQIHGVLTALQDRDPNAAMLHLDVLLGLESQLIFNRTLMDRVWGNSEARAIFAANLVARPRYLGDFLRTFVVEQDDYWVERLEVLRMAKAGGLVLDEEEKKNVTWGVFNKSPSKAVDFWSLAAGPGDWRTGQLAWSPVPTLRELRNQSSPFSWHEIGRARRVIEPVTVEGETFLVVDKVTRPAAQPLARIVVPISDGTYQAKWTTTGEVNGLFPVFGCIGRGSGTSKFGGASDSGERTALVTVSGGCKALGITIQKRSGSINGRVSIGNLTLGGVHLLN